MKTPVLLHTRIIRPVKREDLPEGALASLDPDTNIVVVERETWATRTSLTISQILGLRDGNRHLG